MRIKRTDKDFIVRQKAGRKIHYAGQGKKYTENTAHFSPEEKQGALRQKIMDMLQIDKIYGVVFYKNICLKGNLKLVGVGIRIR